MDDGISAIRLTNAAIFMATRKSMQNLPTNVASEDYGCQCSAIAARIGPEFF
jgi:hypothetical protein